MADIKHASTLWHPTLPGARPRPRPRSRPSAIATLGVQEHFVIITQ